MTWRESSRQDWAPCDHYKITCRFPESFHRDYDDGGQVAVIDTSETHAASQMGWGGQ